jgi:hypothetical protein
MPTAPSVDGLLSKPKTDTRGRIYRGRFTCPDVQWTQSSNDLLATFTITADELADAAESGLLWTDQDVQRGIQPGIEPVPPRELCLAAGFPDTAYVFDAKNADNIVEKLLNGEKIFLNPLVWNLRPGTFEAYWSEDEKSLYLYSGRFYLPDSHHRHQAILKTVRLWRGARRDYPEFSGSEEFKVELYFLNREDEGNYFFDKNQLPKSVAKSKAYDLTTVDDLSLLAKRLIEKSANLSGNVNRVTDKLTNRNPQVITLSTLREMMRTFASSDQLEESELQGMASVAAQFYDMLTEVRPELGPKPISERKEIREKLIVESATMMHGYAVLMKEFNEDLGNLGTTKARSVWRKKLEKLRGGERYSFEGWSGDIFEKRNSLWREVGIVKPGRDGQRLTVLNTGAARSECGRVLRQLLAVDQAVMNLRFLAPRRAA